MFFLETSRANSRGWSGDWWSCFSKLQSSKRCPKGVPSCLSDLISSFFLKSLRLVSSTTWKKVFTKLPHCWQLHVEPARFWLVFGRKSVTLCFSYWCSWGRMDNGCRAVMLFRSPVKTCHPKLWFILWWFVSSAWQFCPNYALKRMMSSSSIISSRNLQYWKI